VDEEHWVGKTCLLASLMFVQSEQFEQLRNFYEKNAPQARFLMKQKCAAGLIFKCAIGPIS